MENNQDLELGEPLLSKTEEIEVPEEKQKEELVEVKTCEDKFQMIYGAWILSVIVFGLYETIIMHLIDIDILPKFYIGYLDCPDGFQKDFINPDYHLCVGNCTGSCCELILQETTLRSFRQVFLKLGGFYSVFYSIGGMLMLLAFRKKYILHICLFMWAFYLPLTLLHATMYMINIDDMPFEPYKWLLLQFKEY